MILVLSAGAGFRSLINSQVDALGSNTLFIQTRVPPTTKNRAANSSGPGGSFSGVVISSFKQRDLDEIKKLGNVVNDYGIVTGLAPAEYSNLLSIQPGKSDPSGPPAQVFGVVITSLVNSDALALRSRSQVPHAVGVNAILS